MQVPIAVRNFYTPVFVSDTASRTPPTPSLKPQALSLIWQHNCFARSVQE